MRATTDTRPVHPKGPYRGPKRFLLIPGAERCRIVMHPRLASHVLSRVNPVLRRGLREVLTRGKTATFSIPTPQTNHVLTVLDQLGLRAIEV